jgi:hypothetical protein
MLRAIVLTVGLALIATPAMAQKTPTTGNNMLRHCSMVEQAMSGQLGGVPAGISEAHDQGTCFGIVLGVMFLANAATRNTADSACISAMITNAQAVRVVVRYLRNHPERLHEPLADLVLAAFVDAWPCKQ